MNTTQEFINKDRLEHAELELKASAIKAQHVNLMMKKKPIVTLQSFPQLPQFVALAL